MNWIKFDSDGNIITFDAAAEEALFIFCSDVSSKHTFFINRFFMLFYDVIEDSALYFSQTFETNGKFH